MWIRYVIFKDEEKKDMVLEGGKIDV